MATIFILACSDIEEITDVPLPPHPMIPILMAEFALLPNATPGLTMVRVERAAVLLMNFLRLRCVIRLMLNQLYKVLIFLCISQDIFQIELSSMA
jgi:hypothetical protein